MAPLLALLEAGFQNRVLLSHDAGWYDPQKTVQKIKLDAAEKGWNVPATHEIHNAVRKAGFDTKEVSVIELCHPEHAAKILKSDEDKVVTSISKSFCNSALSSSSRSSLLPVNIRLYLF